MITLREYLESMGEPAASIRFLLAHPHLIPGYTLANPPATDTGD